MDAEGFCAFASTENLARRAHVKPSLTAKAIAVLEAPDHKSSGDAYEGRRIERVQGGWMVLNAKKYRDITRSGELRQRKRKIEPDQPTEPEQLGATGSNSAQLGATTDLSTSGINTSLPDQNKKRIDKTESKSVPIRFGLDDFDGQIAFEELCCVYSRAERGVIAQKRYEEAIEWCISRKHINRKEAAAYILERAHTYCTLCKFQKGLTKWLEERIFEQADSVWSATKTIVMPIRNPADEMRHQLESD